MLERLTVEGAPKPQGPYSSAVRAGDFLFISGQGPVDAATGEMQAEASVQEQTRLVLRHLQTILQGAGADLARCGEVLRVLARRQGLRCDE